MELSQSTHYVSPSTRSKLLLGVSIGSVELTLPFEAGKLISTNNSNLIADGLDCRVPVAEAFGIIRAGVERMLTLP